MLNLKLLFRTGKKLMSLIISFLLIGLVIAGVFIGVKSIGTITSSVDKAVHPTKDIYMRVKVCSDLFGFHISGFDYKNSPYLLSFIPMSFFSKKDVYCVNDFMGMEIQEYLSEVDGCKYVYYSYDDVPRGEYDLTIECYQIQEDGNKLLASKAFEVKI